MTSTSHQDQIDGTDPSSGWPPHLCATLDSFKAAVLHYGRGGYFALVDRGNVRNLWVSLETGNGFWQPLNFTLRGRSGVIWSAVFEQVAGRRERDALDDIHREALGVFHNELGAGSGWRNFSVQLSWVLESGTEFEGKHRLRVVPFDSFDNRRENPLLKVLGGSVNVMSGEFLEVDETRRFFVGDTQVVSHVYDESVVDRMDSEAVSSFRELMLNLSGHLAAPPEVQEKALDSFFERIASWVAFPGKYVDVIAAESNAGKTTFRDVMSWVFDVGDLTYSSITPKGSGHFTPVQNEMALRRGPVFVDEADKAESIANGVLNLATGSTGTYSVELKYENPRPATRQGNLVLLSNCPSDGGGNYPRIDVDAPGMRNRIEWALLDAAPLREGWVSPRVLSSNERRKLCEWVLAHTVRSGRQLNEKVQVNSGYVAGAFIGAGGAERLKSELGNLEKAALQSVLSPAEGENCTLGELKDAFEDVIGESYSSRKFAAVVKRWNKAAHGKMKRERVKKDDKWTFDQVIYDFRVIQADDEEGDEDDGFEASWVDKAFD